MQTRVTPTLTTLLLSSSLLTATSAFAQTTGTSHPEALDDTIAVSVATPAVAAPQPAAKPSPDVQAPTPVLHPRTALPAADAEIVAPGAPAYSAAAPYTAAVPSDGNPVDGEITSGAVAPANELPEGTLLRARLSQEISTRDTQPNILFNAYVSAPMLKLGRIVVPAGSVLTGRITELSGGHHIGKAASIHLQPEFLTLPSGVRYKIDGQVIDLVTDHRAHVTSEGTITGNDSTPGTATTVGVATGTGAAAGAILGAGVGAIVGASIGAGVSGAVWANQETSSTLHAGTEIIFSLNQPMLLENTSVTAE